MSYKTEQDMGGHYIFDKYGEKVLFDLANAHLSNKGYIWIVCTPSRIGNIDNYYEEPESVWHSDSYVEAFKHAEEIGGTLKRWKIRIM
jgi:hypothetical protein